MRSINGRRRRSRAKVPNRSSRQSFLSEKPLLLLVHLVLVLVASEARPTRLSSTFRGFQSAARIEEGDVYCEEKRSGRLRHESQHQRGMGFVSPSLIKLCPFRAISRYQGSQFLSKAQGSESFAFLGLGKGTRRRVSTNRSSSSGGGGGGGGGAADMKEPHPSPPVIGGDPAFTDAEDTGSEGGRSSPLMSMRNGVWVQPDLSIHMDEIEAGGRKVYAKVRQHVNPLSSSYQRSIELDTDWYSKAFKDTTKPLHIDIGCARGAFPLTMSHAYPGVNFLGLEIRRPLVALCLDKVAKEGLTNCYFLSCNANIDLESIMKAAVDNGANITNVSIQFPDPHFKLRNRKRRVVTAELVRVLERYMGPRSSLFMQSDVLGVVDDMRHVVRKHSEILKDSQESIDSWLQADEDNPFLATEREVSTKAKRERGEDESIYRCFFNKGGGWPPSVAVGDTAAAVSEH